MLAKYQGLRNYKFALNVAKRRLAGEKPFPNRYIGVSGRDYPVYYTTKSDYVLCSNCANGLDKQPTHNPDWYVTDFFVPWRKTVKCAKCGKTICAIRKEKAIK